MKEGEKGQNKIKLGYVFRYIMDKYLESYSFLFLFSWRIGTIDLL